VQERESVVRVQERESMCGCVCMCVDV